MELDAYQAAAHRTDEAKKSTVSLYGLAGEVGSVFSLFKKRVRDRLPIEKFQEQLSEELGDLLWYISSLASLHNLKLSDIAQANIRKANSLFDPVGPTSFDQSYPLGEQLPRSLRIEFRLDAETGRSQMLIEDSPAGDALTDNVREADYYRFHDVFHLSFMTFLGWSPVMRSLMQRKRKSDPAVDENEDGARAAITEEAISAIIFNMAEDNDFFRDIRSIPFSLLKTVAGLTDKFEVRDCTLKQWQQAIWHACQVYRDLVTNSGGIVELDADEPRLEYIAANRDRA